VKELEVLKDLLEKLEHHRIEYMVSGSIAASIYGLARATRDIDIVIELHSDQARSFASLFAEIFYVDELMIQAAVKQEGMFNIIHSQALVKIDFIIRKNHPFRIEEFRRRVRRRLDGFDGFVATIEDLILAKLVWAQELKSEIQVRDVRTLIAINREKIDVGYLTRWAGEIGVEQELTRLFDDRS
jgi:hypothetical protein